MSSPLVSILMTVYNREPYLAAAVESVLASTYQDWELIIVDDCSGDRSVAVARPYTNRDPRIRVFVNEKNLGDYPNRNRAASLAGGKYLKYLDADDTIYPYGLGAMVKAMERYPDAALGVSCSRPEDSEPYPYQLAPAEIFHREFLEKGVLGGGPSGAIIRRDAFEAAGGFRIARLLGDTDMWYRLALKSHPAGALKRNGRCDAVRPASLR